MHGDLPQKGLPRWSYAIINASPPHSSGYSNTIYSGMVVFSCTEYEGIAHTVVVTFVIAVDASVPNTYSSLGKPHVEPNVFPRTVWAIIPPTPSISSPKWFGERIAGAIRLEDLAIAVEREVK